MIDGVIEILLVLLAGVVALLAPVRLRGGGGRIEEERGCWQDSAAEAEAYRASVVRSGDGES